MHTISAEELLKAYNGKYKYVTMNFNGTVSVWMIQPKYDNNNWDGPGMRLILGPIAITDFQDAPAELCIYKAKPSEEDWVGTACWFADSEADLEKPRNRCFGILEKISTTPYVSYHRVGSNVFFMKCRPIRPNEIKFFNDDTAEE